MIKVGKSAAKQNNRLTERIWLDAFGTSPKFPFGKLQIRSERYA